MFSRNHRPHPARAPRPRAACSEPLEPRRLLSATLVRDINTTPYTYPLDILAEPVRVGDTVYFTSDQTASGIELWKTDGAPAGTSLVRDILPGPFSSNPRSLTAVGDTLYFMADDGVSGTELWKTDGTAGGTVRVKDLTPGPEGSYAYRFAALGDVLIFTGPGAAGRDSHAVWRSDGTAAGTVMLKPVTDSSENNSSGPGLRPDPGAAMFKGRLFFTAATAAEGAELWATDGTEAGTARVVDIMPGPDGSYPTALTVVGDRMFFMAGGGTSFSSTGTEPFVTDGTAAGTRLVRDTVPGGSGNFPQMWAGYDGAFYFVGYGSDFWRTDGTPAGTQRAAGIFSSTTWGLAPLGDWLYFVSNFGRELRRTDGSFTDGVMNSTLVKDCSAAPIDANSTNALTVVDGAMYFSAAGEPWKSDGTPDGTVPLAEVSPGEGTSSPRRFIEASDGRVVFFAEDDESLALSRAEPAGAAPTPLHRIRATLDGGGVPYALDPASSRTVIFFANDGPPVGRELWRSDGTPAGTYLLKDFGVGPSGFSPFIIPAVNGRALLPIGYDSATGKPTELWTTDGTPAGTIKFPAPQDIDDPTVHAGRLFFFSTGRLADKSDAGLWSTDGTPAGTTLVKPFAATGSVDMASDGTTLYLALQSGPPTVRTLWKSDGTAAGTVEVTTLNSSPGEGSLTHSGGRLYFTQFVSTPFGFNAELWTSDGTAAGTARVAPLPVLDGLKSHLFTPFAGKLYYRGWDSTHGFEVWSSDGTPANTARVTDLSPTYSSEDINDLEVMDGRLYIAAETGLYRSDGSAAGTTQIPSYTGEPLAALGRQPITTNGLVRVGGRMYFTATQAYQRGGGFEVWRTGDDGATLVPVGDISPGTEGSSPSYLTVAGDTLYFNAFNRLLGSELWMDRPPIPAVVGRHVFYNDSFFDGSDPALNAADDGAIATDKAPLLSGEFASFANVTNYTRGINGVMIDVAGGLPLTALAGLAAGLELKAGPGGDPATWADAPRPSQIAIRPRAGVNGADRVTLFWPDGVLRNTWLRVTVRALPQSGLSADDVFAFGNLVGETGDGPTDLPATSSALAVTSRDALATRAGRLATGAVIHDRFDHNRDGAVNVLDYTATLRNQGRTLTPPTLPPPVAPASSLARTRSISTRRSVLNGS